ncbi:MAG: 5-histidylcysteine sulfoxide synthase [Rickettsiales bacterium]
MTALKQLQPETGVHFDWTGPKPLAGECPGVNADGTLHSLPLLNVNASRQEVLHYFQNSWALNEMLFSALVSEEAFYRRPYHKLRHPMIFYYGHTAAVYVNKLRVAGLLDEPINAEFEQLFEVGVDEMRWDDMHEGNQDVWPEVVEVRAYRKQVYQAICNLIKTHPDLADGHAPITQESPLWALVMGFEHERIHLETSSVLLREMPLEFLKKPDQWPDYHSLKTDSQAPENEMLAVPAGEVKLGKPHGWPSYGWDNEYGNETRQVRPFSASKHLISNGEFHAFVKAGGYVQEKYWSREGWAWRRFRNVKWPAFWVQDGPAGSHLYNLRTIFEVVDMQWDFPAVVNFHEAKAYCAWLSEKEGSDMPYRLLTEAEHHAIRNADIVDAVMEGTSLQQGYNANLSTGGESPVNALTANDKGFHDTFGNVWQWCEDHFHPLEGAEPHPYYDDFSTPCYDGEHQMILGGSFISTGDEASIWARFHFRPHFFQHAGFRVVRSEDGNPASDAKLLHDGGTSNYETKTMLDKYLLMHWGDEQEIWDGDCKAGVAQPDIVHLPLKCAELVVEHTGDTERVLDLGCAVGRSSFELARHFDEVVGVDYSREFVDAATTLKQEGKINYWRQDSGAQGTQLTVQVDKAIDRTKLRFEQGDACALPLHLKGFDAVLMANVLCRLPDPVACLERMQDANALVKPGGVLVMTTPFSWLEEYTAPSKWLDGVQAVKEVLSDFELVHEEPLPFMIREHMRKYEYIITQASVWRRKNAA